MPSVKAHAVPKMIQQWTAVLSGNVDIYVSYLMMMVVILTMLLGMTPFNELIITIRENSANRDSVELL